MIITKLACLEPILIFLLFSTGETNYIFDGNVASRLPKSMFKWDWDNSFTIAGWMLAKTSHNPQFILSLSDGKKLGDNYVGLYVINKIYDDQPRIGFIMNKDHGRCKFHEEWEAALGDMKWRHIAVVVENCNLQVNLLRWCRPPPMLSVFIQSKQDYDYQQGGCEETETRIIFQNRI